MKILIRVYLWAVKSIRHYWWLWFGSSAFSHLQYIPRNMHTVFALLCFVVVIHWLIFPYPSGLLHWHCGNLTIAPVPAKQPWWIWINTSCEFIMNDCITITKQSTTKPCAYFLGYTVRPWHDLFVSFIGALLAQTYLPCSYHHISTYYVGDWTPHGCYEHILWSNASGDNKAP